MNILIVLAEEAERLETAQMLAELSPEAELMTFDSGIRPSLRRESRRSTSLSSTHSFRNWAAWISAAICRNCTLRST